MNSDAAKEKRDFKQGSKRQNATLNIWKEKKKCMANSCVICQRE